MSEDRVLVGTETGHLLLFENGEVKLEFLADVPTGSIAEASPSRSVVFYSVWRVLQCWRFTVCKI